MANSERVLLVINPSVGLFCVSGEAIFIFRTEIWAGRIYFIFHQQELIPQKGNDETLFFPASEIRTGDFEDIFLKEICAMDLWADSFPVETDEMFFLKTIFLKQNVPLVH